MARIQSHFRIFLVLSIFVMLGVTQGCGGSGDSNDTGNPGPTDLTPNDPPPNDPGAPDCSLTISEILGNIEDSTESIPSWDQIDCYTENAVRLPYPAVVMMGGPTPPDENAGGAWLGALEVTLQNHAYLDSWPNIEVVEIGPAPPYMSVDGSSSFYRENDAVWDQRLRSYAIGGLFGKETGRRLRVTYFYPPSFSEPENWWKIGAEDIVDAATFLAWWREFYIPERVDLAIVAERINAEIYMPWNLEVGQTLRSFGDAWLSDLTPQEQVDLAQTIADELAAAIRPVFSGTLVVINYDNYTAWGDHWKQLDLSAYDQINFVFFTSGDLDWTASYLDSQLAGMMEIVERSGIPWVAQEVTVDGDRHRSTMGPDIAFEDIEEDIYRMIFTKFREQPVKPSGIGITLGLIETAGAEAYVRSEMETVSTNGF